jgi:steroid delta-isomerase-like uncharacterized protein
MDRQELLARTRENINAWNEHDADRVAESMAEDGTSGDSSSPELRQGREGAHEFADTYLSAFPDFHIEIRSEMADGNRVATEWTVTGTHQGELAGIAPTGKSITTHGMTVASFNDEGLVTSSFVYWSPAELMGQLAPAAQTAGAQA